MFISILGNGVDIRNIKAHDIFKYALVLMDALFTEEDMSTSCFFQSERGTASDKPPLEPSKVKLLEGKLNVFFFTTTVSVVLISLLYTF